MPKNEIHLHLTGFGPFLDVTENPSSTIMSLVAEHFRKFSSKKKENDDDDDDNKSENKTETKVITVDSAKELEVSVQGVGKYVNELEQSIQLDEKKSDQKEEEEVEETFFVHFGVNRSAESTIAIETEAVNCCLLPPNDKSGFLTWTCCPIVEEETRKQQLETIRRRERVSQEEEEEEEGETENAVKLEPESGDEKFSSDSAGDAPTTTSSASASASCHGENSSNNNNNNLVSTFVTSLTDKVRQICEKMSTFTKNEYSSTSTTTTTTSTTLFSLQPSTDAGTYLCNYIFALSLLKLSCNISKINHRELEKKPSHDDNKKKKKNKISGVFESWCSSQPFIREEECFNGKSANDENNTSNKKTRHSLFIHVLDPERLSCEMQAEKISLFLEQLFFV